MTLTARAKADNVAIEGQLDPGEDIFGGMAKGKERETANRSPFVSVQQHFTNKASL